MTRTRQTTLALTTLLAVLLGMHGAAHADAIMPPRDDCAPGAIGRSSHAGQWCAATTCNADADCASMAQRESMWGGGDHTYACRAIDLCLRSETYQYGGRRRADDPSGNTGTREIASSCTPSCDAPASCTHEKRCVRSDVASPPPAPPPAPTPPPATPPSTVTQGTATPAAASSEQSSDGCAISPGGAGGSALVVLGALALLGVRRLRRSTRRLPPR